MHGHEYGNGYCYNQWAVTGFGGGAASKIMAWNSHYQTNAEYMRLRSFSGMNLLVCNVGKTAAPTGGHVVLIPFA